MLPLVASFFTLYFATNKCWLCAVGRNISCVIVYSTTQYRGSAWASVCCLPGLGMCVWLNVTLTSGNICCTWAVFTGYNEGFACWRSRWPFSGQIFTRAWHVRCKLVGFHLFLGFDFFVCKQHMLLKTKYASPDDWICFKSFAHVVFLYLTTSTWLIRH
jgi:hypothetical protein